MFAQFREYIPLDDDTWNEFVSLFNRLEVAAKTILLHETTISKKLFLVEKGCLRAWFNNNGKDVTFQFFFENSIVASIESFRKSTPSPVAIEAVEPSIVYWLHKKDADRILDKIKRLPSLQDKYIDALFERTYEYMKHFLSFIKDTPQQRYQNLLHEKPQILLRVPQHYIASYLGITTVHLSRIKSKLAREKSFRI